MRKEDLVFRLLDEFRLERYFYLVLCTITAITAIGVTIYTFIYRQTDYLAIAGALGSGGFVTVSITRLLEMWRRCMDALTIKSEAK
jgi:hypothetical protein